MAKSSAVGATIEAPRGGVWGEGDHLPRIVFRFLSSKRRVLVHYGTDKTYF